MRFGSLLRLGVLFCVVLAIVGCARMRETRDRRDQVAPGGIASGERVYINGSAQWIDIRGDDRDNPVILWLDGGPGQSELGPVRDSLRSLHKSFTIVCWDQRGFGQSAKAADLRTAKVSDYVRDVITMTELLSKRFPQKKIYLVGHDWGAVIGLAAASQRPDLYAAFVSVAQRVNSVETDRQLYDSVIESARRAGDASVVRRLKEQGPPPYNARQNGRYALLFGEATNYLPRFYSGSMELGSQSTADDRSFSDRPAGRSGSRAGYDFIYPQLAELDLETQVPSVECPVFFVVGKYDLITPPAITRRYFDSLEAPMKDLVVFDRSGHSPCFSEPENFTAYMTGTVLARTE